MSLENISPFPIHTLMEEIIHWVLLKKEFENQEKSILPALFGICYYKHAATSREKN